jgi:hypothetical protein
MDAAALEQIVRLRNPTVDQERAAEASGRWKDYKPAISLDGVAPDLAQSVHELVDRLRIFPKREN